MAKVGKRGQVTIPKPMREALKLGAIPQVGDSIVITPATAPKIGRFERVRGSLKSDLTTDQIMALLRGR